MIFIFSLSLPGNIFVLKNLLGYIFAFRFGNPVSYEREGVEPAGDADKGECGIRIKNIDFKHIGEWRCVLIRQSLSGLGSEIAEKRITLVAESSRLRKEDLNEPRLLGFKRNVVIASPPPKEFEGNA